MQMIISILMMCGGFLLLIKGADWFVEGASNIAARLRVSQLVIGLTVVAMGTSLPEAAISISAAFKGNEGIAVGNIVGSNIMNIGLILGITAIITPLAVKKTTRRYEIPIVVLSTAILTFMGLNDNVVTRIEGLIMLVAFGFYLAYTFKVVAGSEIEENAGEPVSEKSIVRIITIIILGGGCIAVGADLTVDGASALARMFGISENIIGLTIVAFGTSLPELVTCVVAALKKEADIAIGNIVGSNIFNILFVLGTASAIRPIGYKSEFFADSLVCIAMPVVLLILVLNRDRMLKRWGGIVLLACYVAYFLLFNLNIIKI